MFDEELRARAENDLDNVDVVAEQRYGVGGEVKVKLTMYRENKASSMRYHVEEKREIDCGTTMEYEKTLYAGSSKKELAEELYNERNWTERGAARAWFAFFRDAGVEVHDGDFERTTGTLAHPFDALDEEVQDVILRTSDFDDEDEAREWMMDMVEKHNAGA